MARLTLELAEKIAAKALEQSRAGGSKPLAIAILDEAGHVKLLLREDGASMFRNDIALGKAWGAVAMGAASRVIAQVAQQNPNFVNALVTASNGRLVPNPGGVLIRDGGEIIGAVGISGDLAERDESFAAAGIEAAGLTADSGAPPSR